tara:strand:+ start:408 stop:2861 length:2454 start_codon:yes stop_codon:yes gene_type:complete
MVKIPTFENKSISTKISKSVIQAPNIAKTSTLVGKSVENLGKTLLKSAVADQKAKNQYEANKAKQAASFEIAKYKQDAALDLQTFKAEENYKTTVFEIEEDLKNKFALSALRIKQKNEVLSATSDLQQFSTDTMASLMTSKDLDDVDGFIEQLNNKKNSYTFSDDATKILFDNEFLKILETDKYKVQGNIRKNIIDVGISDYNTQVDDAIFKAVYGNDHEKKIALDSLFSADGIIKEGLDSQLFLSYENESTRVRNQYGLSLYEKMVNDDPQAFINLLNDDPDKIKNLLTTDQIVNFEALANNKITKLQNAEIALLKAQASSLNSFYNDEKKLLTNITRANLPELNAALEQAQNLKLPGTDDVYDPELVANLEALISLVDIVDQFKTLNHTQGKQTIQELEEDYNNRYDEGEVLSTFDDLRLQIFKSINKDMTNNINDDAISVASKYDVIDDIVRVDFGADLSNEEEANKFFQQVDENIKQGLQVAEHFGLANPQFLTKETAAVLSDIVNNADGPNDIIAIADLIVNTYEDHALDVFRQLSKEAPLLAEIGGQMELGNENFAVHISKGFMLDDQQMIPNFTSNRDFRAIVFEELGDSMADNPQTLKSKLDAINYAVASVGYEQGWYNSSLTASNVVQNNKEEIQKIIQQSVGARYDGGERISGGTIRWNDKVIILPTNFNTKDLSDKDFRDLILDEIADSPGGDDLLIAAGESGASIMYPGQEITIGLPTTTPFVDVDERSEVSLNAKQVFGGDTGEGGFIMSGRYTPYFWDQVGPGLYMLSLFDPTENKQEPEYLMYPGTNLPFIFDLESITKYIQ